MSDAPDPYTQRAAVAVLFAKMAIRLGYDAGTGKDESGQFCEKWSNVLYVQLPEGQFSWHFAPRDVHLLEGLPKFRGQWDGTFNGRDLDKIKRIKP